MPDPRERRRILRFLAIGVLTASLAYDEIERTWWIVVSGGGARREIAFIDARREVCWETFDSLLDRGKIAELLAARSPSEA